MLFDLRSRGRRRTVQAVYLFLAILIGGGLVLFGVGAGNGLGGLLNGLTGSGSTAGQQSAVSQAEKNAIKATQTQPEQRRRLGQPDPGPLEHTLARQRRRQRQHRPVHRRRQEGAHRAHPGLPALQAAGQAARCHDRHPRRPRQPVPRQLRRRHHRLVGHHSRPTPTRPPPSNASPPTPTPPTRPAPGTWPPPRPSASCPRSSAPCCSRRDQPGQDQPVGRPVLLIGRPVRRHARPPPLPTAG